MSETNLQVSLPAKRPRGLDDPQPRWSMSTTRHRFGSKNFEGARTRRMINTTCRAQQLARRSPRRAAPACDGASTLRPGRRARPAPVRREDCPGTQSALRGRRWRRNPRDAPRWEGRGCGGAQSEGRRAPGGSGIERSVPAEREEQCACRERLGEAQGDTVRPSRPSARRVRQTHNAAAGAV